MLFPPCLREFLRQETVLINMLGYDLRAPTQTDREVGLSGKS